ncbi:MAG TPA: SDR family oxidoreductase [Lutibacter sp.]|nr:SDR family oxidoreductase [Lutibacter sp.]
MAVKVVVIGSNGLLGQTLVNKLYNNKAYKLYAMASGENRNSKATELSYFEIDITDFSSIKLQLSLIAPNFIINALAMTNVDACEVEKNHCDAINVHFVKELAINSKELRARFIHISTDFIFDGEKGNFYNEIDTPNPVNYYGLSKLRAEKVVCENATDFTILRTILVYGKVANMKRSNLVLWVKKSLENRESIRVINDQYRMPTYVGNLANACILAIQKNATGIYHISDKEYLSIYEIAQQIADFYNLPKELIQPISTLELGQKAKRPPKTGFVLDKALKELGYNPLSFIDGLTLFHANL